MGLNRRKLLGTCVMAGLGLVWAAGPALAGPEDEAKAIAARAATCIASATARHAKD